MDTTAANYGPVPQRCTCPYCHANIETRIQSETTPKTHLNALLLCLLGCIFCVCIPYCMDSCKNTDHYCPSCKAYLGTYKS